VDTWYYIHRKNPPIHYIVFATPHKKKYLLQKRQLIPLSFLLSKKPRSIRRENRLLLRFFVTHQALDIAFWRR
jgi:hypothetical protein